MSYLKVIHIVAHKAHLNWDVVEVTGVVQRVGNLWQLADPHDFHVAIEGRRQLGGQARMEQVLSPSQNE